MKYGFSINSISIILSIQIAFISEHKAYKISTRRCPLHLEPLKKIHERIALLYR